MTCRVEGCDKPRRSSRTDVCEMHYYRHRRTGSYDLLPRPVYVPPVCQVDGCADRACRHAAGLHVCREHARRWGRSGRFHKIRLTQPPRTRRSTCIIEGCDDADDGPHGYCKRHKTRLDRHGDALTCIQPSERRVPCGVDNANWTGDQASYPAVHQRLHYQRGSARDHPCVDCGQRAAHWSYDHADPNERSTSAGPYSVDLAHYQPRCVSCHKRFDLSFKKTTDGNYYTAAP